MYFEYLGFCVPKGGDLSSLPQFLGLSCIAGFLEPCSPPVTSYTFADFTHRLAFSDIFLSSPDFFLLLCLQPLRGM